MGTVALLSLTNVTKYGGCATYTAHLAFSMRALGIEPEIYCVGRSTESGLRRYTHGLFYQNISIDAALTISDKKPSVIVYSNWSSHALAITRLISNGLPLVMHDPAELAPELIELCGDVHVIAIRRLMRDRLVAMGVDCQFIPHPYVRSCTNESRVVGGGDAVAWGRVDFRKHTDIVCVANDILKLKGIGTIGIYGSINRMFAFHKLDKLFPGWRANYHGQPPPTSDVFIQVCRGRHAVIDLTRIESDGDGSQYVFLEAWDVGTPLIVNRGWIHTGSDEVRHGETAIAIATAEELVEAVNSPLGDMGLVEGGYEQLRIHEPSQVVPAYLRVMGISAGTDW